MLLIEFFCRGGASLLFDLTRNSWTYVSDGLWNGKRKNKKVVRDGTNL